jgi:hypothetical protein
MSAVIGPPLNRIERRTKVTGAACDMPIKRVTRAVGVFNAGRIINPKTARSRLRPDMLL